MNTEFIKETARKAAKEIAIFMLKECGHNNQKENEKLVADETNEDTQYFLDVVEKIILRAINHCL